jgi:hypothetical protein
MTLFIYGILLGIAGTILVQEIHTSLERYKDRKQAEFEAAVNAEAEHRRIQARLREDKSLEAWGKIVSYDPSDPFA